MSTQQVLNDPHSARAPFPATPGVQTNDDRRKSDRERTYKAARIGFGGGRATLGCVVRNLSATGACLGVENPAQIPERFNLVFDSGEPSRMARVVWRSATRIGVTFG